MRRAEGRLATSSEIRSDYSLHAFEDTYMVDSRFGEQPIHMGNASLDALLAEALDKMATFGYRGVVSLDPTDIGSAEIEFSRHGRDAGLVGMDAQGATAIESNTPGHSHALRVSVDLDAHGATYTAYVPHALDPISGNDQIHYGHATSIEGVLTLLDASRTLTPLDLQAARRDVGKDLRAEIEKDGNIRIEDATQSRSADGGTVCGEMRLETGERIEYSMCGMDFYARLHEPSGTQYDFTNAWTLHHGILRSIARERGIELSQFV